LSVLAILKPITGITVAGGLTNPERLLTPDPKEVAVKTAAGVITIDIDLGSVQPVSAIYLGAMSGALDFTVTGGAASYTTTALSNMLVAPKLRAVAPRRALTTFTDQSWRFIRLTSTTSAAAAFQIGNLVVADAFRPTWGHEWGAGRGIGDTGIASRLISGGFGIMQGARFKTWDFSLGDLTDSEYEELFDLLWQIGETNPAVLCEDPDVTANLDARIHYGKFGKLDKYERLVPGATRWNLKFEEWV
jgi:hypothetical protein